MSTPDSPSLNVGAVEMDQIDPPSPWRPLVVPAIIVAIILAICWALFAHFGRVKPDASGVVLRQVAYPVQVDAAVPPPDPGMAGGRAPQHETLLLVQARVTNVSQKPLTIFDMVANIKLDGNNNQSTAAPAADIDRVFERFPDLAGERKQPLLRHQTIAPGQSAEGLMIFNYDWSPQQWNQRTDAHAVISFQDGRSLILPLQ